MEKINLIPNFITGKSKEELRKNMLLNNIKFNAHFKYFDIQKTGNTWVAWFYDEVVFNDIAQNNRR